MPHHIDGLAGGWLIEQQKAPPLKAGEGATTQCIPGVDQ